MGILQDWKLGWVFVLFSAIMFFLGINFLVLDLLSPSTAFNVGQLFWLNYLEVGAMFLIGLVSLFLLAPKYASEKRKDDSENTNPQLSNSD
ncbi:MAG: hypothetical protein JRN20_11055 [Nitrososphaerota archaeon]|jgi:hypothetical protein|nr:hypothetical protein [Nitrososphaerota archaeon]MDG6924384.1 hypothetical protein [Nitrososphaerota archaeon]